MNRFVVAEYGIRQLHAAYVDAVWRQDVEAFGDCFAEDAEWRVGGTIMRGREQVMLAMRGVFPKFRRLLMNFRTPIIELGDGFVLGRTYVNEQSVMADGTPFGPVGIYFERFVDHGDRWRFQWRLFQTNYAGPPDMSGSFFDVADYGAPPAMPPLDEETYARSETGPKLPG